MNYMILSFGRQLHTISTLFLLTLFTLTSRGQTSKTYNGVFNTSNLNGNATYQYFDNGEGGRTYHGGFKFSSNNNLVSITAILR